MSSSVDVNDLVKVIRNVTYIMFESLRIWKHLQSKFITLYVNFLLENNNYYYKSIKTTYQKAELLNL